MAPFSTVVIVLSSDFPHEAYKNLERGNGTPDSEYVVEGERLLTWGKIRYFVEPLSWVPENTYRLLIATNDEVEIYGKYKPIHWHPHFSISI